MTGEFSTFQLALKTKAIDVIAGVQEIYDAILHQ